DKRSEKEEYAWIIDYLPYGNPTDNRPGYQKKPLVQAMGDTHFVLMELVPKLNANPQIHSRVYIGDGDRDEIDHVKHRIHYNDLSHGAQLELPFVIEECVKQLEGTFVKFFNDAHSITSRQHMLELLPGIGKKLMWAIIEEKKKGDFKDFQDLHDRVGGVHTPEKVLANRIMEELKDDNIKYRLFTTTMRRPRRD
ncbi:MAG: DUF655 domain-containing protein, partial [Methanosarcinaceae archaeon]